MITQNRYTISGTSYQGLSTDDKPNAKTQNALFLELDTGDFYYCAEPASEELQTVVEPQSLTWWATEYEGLYGAYPQMKGA